MDEYVPKKGKQSASMSTSIHLEDVPTLESFELEEMESYPGTWTLTIGAYPAQVVVFMTKEQARRLLSLDCSEQGRELWAGLWEDPEENG
jgi:hypothetical protein